MATRKATSEERRRLRAEARARVTVLRRRLREAQAAKKQRLRELVRIIRAERTALRDRLRETRRARLAELREWERAEHAKARADWKRRREEARRTANDELERVRAELAADNARALEMRRIARDARTRAEDATRPTESDDHVRGVIPRELVPLFDKVKQSIRASGKVSRAEAFLRLAEQHPEEVFRVVEPSVERMIRDTILELGRARRGAQACGCVHPPKAAPANGNGLAGGGPRPEEVARVRELESRPRHAQKGEGLDTTEIAKRIREEIKEAVRSGVLPKAKYSVRTDKYSMGSSIDVVVSHLPFRVLNPDAFRVDRGANWVTFDSANHRSRFTPQAQEVERKLNAIIDPYHWDRSDSMTDYYDERFARDVRLTEDKAEWEKLEAAKVAAARASEARE